MEKLVLPFAHFFCIPFEFPLALRSVLLLIYRFDFNLSFGFAFAIRAHRLNVSGNNCLALCEYKTNAQMK